MSAIFLKDQKRKKRILHLCKNAKELVLPSPPLNVYFAK